MLVNEGRRQHDGRQGKGRDNHCRQNPVENDQFRVIAANDLHGILLNWITYHR
jgi:hypothetical protein